MLLLRFRSQTAVLASELPYLNVRVAPGLSKFLLLFIYLGLKLHIAQSKKISFLYF